MIERLTDAVSDGDDFELRSPDFEDGGSLPSWTGFTNENTSPALEVGDVPAAAESLLLSVVHPEAAEVVGHAWVHWLVWNVDPGRSTIPRGWSPGEDPDSSATEGVNDFLEYGWGGPSPPSEQVETYRFRVYALDSTLPLPAFTRRTRVASTVGLEGDVVGAAEVTADYDAARGTVFDTQGVTGLRPPRDD